jgi:hypothetical protein
MRQLGAPKRGEKTLCVTVQNKASFCGPALNFGTVRADIEVIEARLLMCLGSAYIEQALKLGTKWL